MTTQPPAPEAAVAQSQRPTAAFATAARHLPSWLRLLSIAIPGLALDLWSKQWAFHTLLQGGRVEVIPYILDFRTALNPGALFGIGAGQTPLFLIASIVALALVGWMFAQTPRSNRIMHIALGGILAGALGNMYDRVFIKLQPTPYSTANGRVFMENTGPAPDAAQFQVLKEFPADAAYPSSRPAAIRRVTEVDPPVGFVRDFIYISKRWFGGNELWPWVFNVADMLLVGGVIILALQLLFGRDHPGRAPLPPPAKETANVTESAPSAAPGGPR